MEIMIFWVAKTVFFSLWVLYAVIPPNQFALYRFQISDSNLAIPGASLSPAFFNFITLSISVQKVKLAPETLVAFYMSPLLAPLNSVIWPAILITGASNRRLSWLSEAVKSSWPKHRLRRKWIFSFFTSSITLISPKLVSLTAVTRLQAVNNVG